MKILCHIDSLGAGGAQRQLATLAVCLKKRGHDVRFLVYHTDDHFMPLLEDASIPVQVVAKRSHFRRALAIRRILRKSWQDVVLAFLEGPTLYAEMARLPRQNWGLVVGERVADPNMKSLTGRFRRTAHRIADAVVCNSHTNKLMLESTCWLPRSQLTVVYNTVDLRLFGPRNDLDNDAKAADREGVKIVVAASYHPRKNMMGVAKALLLLKHATHVPRVVVDWYGAVQPDRTSFEEVNRFSTENGLEDSLHLHGAIRTIGDEFRRASAVGLFSFYEGLPNAVCEAMACGKPILISNVCDAGNLVREGVNGFLCDPHDPASIASAFKRFALCSNVDRHRMEMESRKTAEQLFCEDAVVDRYERILEATTCGNRLPADCAWPISMPLSAEISVRQWLRS